MSHFCPAVRLQTPDELDQLLDNISRGYRMGLQAKPLLAQKWEANWDKSLAAWRSELGIKVIGEASVKGDFVVAGSN